MVTLMGGMLGRIIIAVSLENEAAFLKHMAGSTTTYLGTIENTQSLSILDGFDEIISADVSQMVQSWQSTLDMTGAEI